MADKVFIGLLNSGKNQSLEEHVQVWNNDSCITLTIPSNYFVSTVEFVRWHVIFKLLKVNLSVVTIK